MPKILFVCLGNICRSPAAEGVMKRLTAGEPGWEIDSAGTGRYHIGDLPDRRMRLHARDRGLTLNHICRQVNADDFSHFDLIIGMDDANYDDLRELCPDPALWPRIHRMAEWFGPACHYQSVPDPYYEGSEGFELVLDLLEEACANLRSSLRQ